MIIDFHIHVYPEYDRRALLESFIKNASVAADDPAGFVLVERDGVSVFGEWRDGHGLPDGCDVSHFGQSAVRVTYNGRDIFVYAGRQVACAERLEILSVGAAPDIRDGVRASDAIRAIAAANGLPVLAWGIGKWLFARGKIVDALLDEFSPQQLAICDTSLRPAFWPTPRQMAAAKKAGRAILAGSDPLPRKREECCAGLYRSVLEGYAPPAAGDAAGSLLSFIAENPQAIASAGVRSSPRDFLRRH